MAELHYFQGPAGRAAVALPFRLDDLIAGWAAVQRAMLREVAEGFSRDEWAYLAAFLDGDNLRAPFLSFGAPASARPCDWLLRPRALAAVWLPSNVSLLGPLTLSLLSLTGCDLWLKSGSGDASLTEGFLAFALENATPALAARLGAVRIDRLDRTDPRHAEAAARAGLRIVFGSDEAAAAIHALPHPVSSAGVSFSDRRSEAWLDPARADDEVLRTLARVFGIYGQAGCTSPQRVVVLGDAAAARAVRDRLAALYPQVVRPPAPHLASECVMARQWAAALGWDAVATAGNGAVLATGALDLPRVAATLFLPIVPATLDLAFATLPPNLQTLGLALDEGPLLERLAATRVLRIVPLRAMHHFGAVWDGEPWFRRAFEQVEVRR